MDGTGNTRRLGLIADGVGKKKFDLFQNGQDKFQSQLKDIKEKFKFELKEDPMMKSDK